MTTVVMPALGESVSEGTVVRWMASPGQRVERDQPLVEIATDKANTEVPSPAAGVLVEQLAAEGTVVQVGAPLARLDDAALPKSTPVVRNVAQEHGLDLGAVQGSGSGGRIVKADVVGLVEPRSAPPPPEPPRSVPPTQLSRPSQAPPVTTRAYRTPRYAPQPGDQVVPFDQRRRLIAEHMVYSKQTSPHVPCTAEVDMTRLAKLRGQWKAAKETGGRAPSFLVGVCRAAVQALGEFPRLNAVVQDESIILRKDVNLAVAVETEKGLLVPVIRKADEKSILGLSRAIEELAARARSGKITADELSGGSFTVSNPGLKGNLFGAAIINQPQTGILRMGEIVKRAVVREVDGEDAIVIRQMMYLTLSYDHRVIDGVTGNGFLHRVKELIEAAEFTL